MRKRKKSQEKWDCGGYQALNEVCSVDRVVDSQRFVDRRTRYSIPDVVLAVCCWM